ncbi:MAG: hypothetical protein EXR62_08990 [Chloroflexi bacterium]|nr:hypothetical protein [Chloroflexota bacterium]
MKVLTEDAVLICAHDLGLVANRPSQDLVTIVHRRVLVEDDPENRSISKCPNVGLTIKPCLLTLRVETGYSEFVRIEGKRICLDMVTGLTDGTPPGTVKYRVREPGQELVDETGGAA